MPAEGNLSTQNEILKINLSIVEKALDELLLFMIDVADHIERMGGIIGRIKVASGEGISLDTEIITKIILNNENIQMKIREMVKDYLGNLESENK